MAMAEARLQAALERFDRMVEQAPDFAEGWNKRATVHYLMGDYRASVRDIQRTLGLEPRHFGALSGLGLIYDAIDQPAAALRSFEAAVAINPHLGSIKERIERAAPRARRLGRPEAARARSQPLRGAPCGAVASGRDLRASAAGARPGRMAPQRTMTARGLADRRARRRPPADRGRRRLDPRRAGPARRRAPDPADRRRGRRRRGAHRSRGARCSRHRGRLAAASARAQSREPRLAGRARRPARRPCRAAGGDPAAAAAAAGAGCGGQPVPAGARRARPQTRSRPAHEAVRLLSFYGQTVLTLARVLRCSRRGCG